MPIGKPFNTSLAKPESTLDKIRKKIQSELSDTTTDTELKSILQAIEANTRFLADVESFNSAEKEYFTYNNLVTVTNSADIVNPAIVGKSGYYMVIERIFAQSYYNSIQLYWYPTASLPSTWLNGQTPLIVDVPFRLDENTNFGFAHRNSNNRPTSTEMDITVVGYYTKIR